MKEQRQVTPGEREALLLATRFSFRRLGYVVGAVAAGVLAYKLRGVIVPLFLAFVLAYALDPVVDRLESWKVPRSLGALLVMLGLTCALAGVATVAVPYFAKEFADASKEFPEQVAKLWGRVGPWIAHTFHVKVPSSWGDVRSTFGTHFRTRAPDVLSGAIRAVFGTVNRVVVLAGSLIIPVFSLYLLMDFDAIIAKAQELIPRRYERGISDIVQEVHEKLGRYLRGQFTASCVLASLYATGLTMLGIRLAIPIGIITGFLAFIPYFGFGIGMTMAVAMSLLDWHSAGTVVGVLLVMLGGQVVDAMVVTPRIVGGSVGLKPLEVLLTMMTAATLFGFVGVLLAVPIGAVVKILVRRAVKFYLKTRFYAEIPEVAPPSLPLAPITPLTPGAHPFMAELAALGSQPAGSIRTPHEGITAPSPQRQDLDSVKDPPSPVAVGSEGASDTTKDAASADQPGKPTPILPAVYDPAGPTPAAGSLRPPFDSSAPSKNLEPQGQVVAIP